MIMWTAASVSFSYCHSQVFTPIQKELLMRQLLFLSFLCLGLCAYGQDLIISEVSTDVPDYVELHNPTPVAIDPTGYTLHAA